MKLLQALNHIANRMQSGFPAHACSIALLTTHNDMAMALDTAKRFSHCHIECLVLLDPLLSGRGQFCDIPIAPVPALASHPELEKVLYCPEKMGFELYMAAEQLAAVGILSFYTSAPIKPFDYAPDFLLTNQDRLERIFSCLADTQSQEVFAGRVKVSITGNNGYRVRSLYSEYRHPLFTIPEGSNIIDGGVGGAGEEGVGVTQWLAEKAGLTGHVYSFEPEPQNCAEALEALRSYPNVTLSRVGLWDKEEMATFEAHGRQNLGSRIVTDQQDSQKHSIQVQLTTIDRFVLDQTLPRVDVIKLDVEGADLAALHGAEETLRRFTPDLMVCLYHRLDDIFLIPEFIINLDLGYRIYLGHHTPLSRTTVLYATARGHESCAGNK